MQCSDIASNTTAEVLIAVFSFDFVIVNISWFISGETWTESGGNSSTDGGEETETEERETRVGLCSLTSWIHYSSLVKLVVLVG